MQPTLAYELSRRRPRAQLHETKLDFLLPESSGARETIRDHLMSPFDVTSIEHFRPMPAAAATDDRGAIHVAFGRLACDDRGLNEPTLARSIPG